jgi:hypothetical protein
VSELRESGHWSMFRKSCSTFLGVGQFEFLLVTDAVEKGRW